MFPCQISVIIPCHNDGRHLTDAVESVLSQESPVERMEVIVVDDHSSDPKTLDVLTNLKESDPRVRILHNIGRLGPAAARNFGVSSADGEWIAFLDADDIWLPGGLAARWQIVQSERDAQWISADFQLVAEDGSVLCENFCKTMIPASLILRPAFDSGKHLKLLKPVREIIACSITWTGTVIVTKKLFLAVGGFEESLLRAQDIHLWLRLASESDLVFVPRTVAWWRQHRAMPPLYQGSAEWMAAIKMLLQDRRLRPYRTLLRNKLALCSSYNISGLRCRGEIWAALRESAKALPLALTGASRLRSLLGAAALKR